MREFQIMYVSNVLFLMFKGYPKYLKVTNHFQLVAYI